MKRRSFHRAVFVAAGAYNLAWGAVTALMPQWPLRVGGMEPMRYPEIMACLAMVVGVYGLLYLEVARRPENGVAIAAVGLLGKVLGPIGMAVMVVRGEWTLAAALAVTLTNDFAWWIPFGLYLRDATRRPEAA